MAIAKRLDCGAFTAALVRAVAFYIRLRLVRAKAVSPLRSATAVQNAGAALKTWAV
jgi:hypothetical protein